MISSTAKWGDVRKSPCTLLLFLFLRSLAVSCFDGRGTYLRFLVVNLFLLLGIITLSIPCRNRPAQEQQWFLQGVLLFRLSLVPQHPPHWPAPQLAQGPLLSFVRERQAYHPVLCPYNGRGRGSGSGDASGFGEAELFLSSPMRRLLIDPAREPRLPREEVCSGRKQG
ncbi:uncharacterized protein EDB93DRAFT_489431 [Suillus bovinus]|uniref:uncharacterized protein n=1 Tax=Suillus bovinus TaxID=48563 RepID=UPI001B85E5FD|nr:uncharacterized protein EDB93DRAFT_489431 [Suillus bovinus]KAG2146156.1 hypothetical protein EDB93DRAFT_489431 [Suillus bovinus]